MEMKQQNRVFSPQTAIRFFCPDFSLPFFDASMNVASKVLALTFKVIKVTTCFAHSLASEMHFPAYIH